MIIGISGYVGNKLTGIGRVLLNVLINLAEKNPLDTFVVFENKDFDAFSVTFQHTPNVKIVKTSVSKESAIGNILWHQHSYQRLLEKYKCEVSFIPNFSLLLWKNIPTVVIIHDMIEFHVPGKFSPLRMLYRKFSVPRMARKADFIITVSESSKRDIVKFCKVPAGKIKVVLNGVDVKRFRRYESSEVTRVLGQYGLAGTDFLLFVGTIDYPGKNIKVLIEAFFNLKAKYKIAEKLVVVGKNGHNSKVIYDFVKSSPFQSDVIFTGFLSDEDLPLLYNGARVFLYLSLYEGFGLPVLEAMACGTPVICPDTSSFPEIVNGLNVAVNPIDVEAIELKMFELMNDSELRNHIGNAGYDKSKKYRWELAADEYMSVFKWFIKN
ncbi:MAG TPA: glycosyltransferase family 1 protein [Marinilabiliaceae bacterium]|nr:glycosyltransferase family 1 protein [Marinilabiliaceae bacterium]